MKKWLTGILAASALVLAACGNSASNDDMTNVGILLSADHASLTAAQDGFVKALDEAGYVDGENITVNIQNSQGSTGNLNTMAAQVAENNDIMLGISTASAQALATQTSDKPILFTAVTDPEGAGLVESNDAPGGNITGTSDMVPIEEQIALLFSIVPDAQRVGIIYNSSEPNSQVQADLAIAEIEANGGEAVVSTVTSTNDVQQVAEQLMQDIDALYIPTDNTLAASAATVGNLAIEYQIPLVAGSIDHVAEGGLATYGIDYESLGHQAGQMAVDILENGTSPADIPVETAAELELFVNEDMAEALGIDPASITME